MIRSIGMMVAGLALAALAAACESGGESEPAPDAQPAAADAAAEPSVGCDPDGVGACQNETDCPIAEDGSGAEAARACGLACAGSSDEQCTSECIASDTSLTEPCADCLATYIDCAIEHCLSECLSSDEELCATCQRTKPSVEASCQAVFETCSGLTEVE